MFTQITGDGNVVVQDRNVGDFTGIVVKSGIDLMISQGDQAKLAVKADQNLQEYIISEVKDNVLYVYIKENTQVSRSHDMDALVTVTELNKVKISGGGDVQSQSMITTDEIGFGLSGGGDLDFELAAIRADCLVSGGGDAVILGGTKANNVDITISGGGNLDMEIACEKLTTTVSGGGDVRIAAGDNVNKADLTILGGGELDLMVNAESLNVTVSGGGDTSLTGSGNELTCEIRSGGNLNAGKYKARNVNLNLTGGSADEVHAEENLKVVASGGGQLYVIGNALIDAKLTGGSEVHQK